MGPGYFSYFLYPDGAQYGMWPRGGQKKKNHHGDEGAFYEFPMNEEYPAPLQSGNIINVYTFLCPAGRREALL